MTMQQRKIVKAIKPPDNAIEVISPPSDPATEGAEDKDIDRDSKRYALPGNVPSVEGEVQQKIHEKTRRDRMDAAASVKREKKAKGLDEKRRSTNSLGVAKSPTGTSEEGQESTAAPAVTKQPRGSIFSVESARPEHKRTVGNASLPDESEPLGKKFKLDSMDEATEGASEEVVAKKRWMGGAKLIAAAAVVALGAFVLMRVARKK